MSVVAFPNAFEDVGPVLDNGLKMYSDQWFVRASAGHPSRDECPDPECMICGYRDCPDHEPLHYDTDGPCPSCNDEPTEP